jgi:hypothetical protein
MRDGAATRAKLTMGARFLGIVETWIVQRIDAGGAT